jgi:hypothetical protein
VGHKSKLLMIYELAMELKQAGFPQGGKGTWAFPPDAIVVRSSDRVYVPSLSELIEACGDENFKLCHDIGGWHAEKIDRGDTQSYASPEEAVARLWLALQK